MWRWTTHGAGAALVVLLAGGSLAVAAVGDAYHGKSSQKQPVSFRVSGGEVRGFFTKVLERCPDGHTLVVSSHYPAMKIARNQFGGKFVPVGGQPGEKSMVRGRVKGSQATGQISATDFSAREGALCHASVRFTARHT